MLQHQTDIVRSHLEATALNTKLKIKSNTGKHLEWARKQLKVICVLQITGGGGVSDSHTDCAIWLKFSSFVVVGVS